MFLVGYLTGSLSDESRKDWGGTSSRPLNYSAWYPTLVGAKPPEGRAFFELGKLEHGAPVLEGQHPVVLLSHGTGGSAESLGWLARGLAEQGFVVLGANHHGNTGREPYFAEGFLCWWERSRDLTVLLSQVSQTGPLAGHLDTRAVSALGFSLGGPTVLALLGARYSMPAFAAWFDETPGVSRGPAEFPDLPDRIPDLLRESATFRTSWEGHGADLTDSRVGRAITLAAAPPVRAFTSDSLAAVNRPVTLISSGADTEAPVEQCSDWLVAQNLSFDHVSMGAQVGHYTFLGLPAEGSFTMAPQLFTDAPGIDRAKVHADCLDAVLKALA